MLTIDKPSIAWCRTADILLFLDIEKDRYFRLPAEQNRAELAALDARSGPSWQQPPQFSRPGDYLLPGDVSSHIGNGNFTLSCVARAIWLQKRLERRIAARTLNVVLGEVKQRFDQIGVSSATLDPEAQRCIRSFEQARLIRTTADRCLPQSLALATSLVRLGVRPNVVIGVQAFPFAAHCWVQHREIVLNDSLEEVLRFTPILVL
ncbi:lasso peptide biosynthesis B2 protein [Qipengyuania qiaonensis]|uniref:Lasso peptide biosynthesis B2 protein n=1 Tax=Qipengyuania qiaonensis TaxID=2867240 RepID=A0ABS7J9M5_9SPHN|nr:lasso peptide biosynthesis B2 protein [Qipengyuania qiaonensis]MBX7481677.1 lasso peptide biosynthesis B2 protein [Qipengyuania qiaonensis]